MASYQFIISADSGSALHTDHQTHPSKAVHSCKVQSRQLFWIPYCVIMRLKRYILIVVERRHIPKEVITVRVPSQWDLLTLLLACTILLLWVVGLTNPKIQLCSKRRNKNSCLIKLDGGILYVPMYVNFVGKYLYHISSYAKKSFSNFAFCAHSHKKTSIHRLRTDLCLLCAHHGKTAL